MHMQAVMWECTKSRHLSCNLDIVFNFTLYSFTCILLLLCICLVQKVLENKPISKQCDVYSYGIVVWELLTHKIPFEEAGTDHDLHKMVVMEKKVSAYS